MEQSYEIWCDLPQLRFEINKNLNHIRKIGEKAMFPNKFHLAEGFWKNKNFLYSEA